MALKRRSAVKAKVRRTPGYRGVDARPYRKVAGSRHEMEGTWGAPLFFTEKRAKKYAARKTKRSPDRKFKAEPILGIGKRGRSIFRITNKYKPIGQRR